MRKFLLTFFAVLMLLFSQAQTPVLNDNFEGVTTGWTNYSLFSSPVTSWIINDCAGNGLSAAGTKAMYPTKGGSSNDCTITGLKQYRYADATTTDAVIYYKKVVTTGITVPLTFKMDYKVTGEAYAGVGEYDYGQLVYSYNKTTWYALSTKTYNITSWTTATWTLPAFLNNTVWYFGAMWVNDNTVVNNGPLAIDNLSITYISPLNVTLGDFEAIRHKEMVLIHWNSISENNLDRYYLQYSTDSQHWETINEQHGVGFANYYKFNRAFNEAGYYRLKMYNSNEDWTYSQTKYVPAFDKFNYKKTLYNLNGQIIQNNEVKSSGLYLLQSGEDNVKLTFISVK